MQKQLDAHWKNTEKERKRTHSGKMYEKYMEENMSENNDMNVVKCRYDECCNNLYEYQDNVCDGGEFDSYKDCGVYKMFVELKAEYDKMGVVERFNFIAVLTEEDG